MEELTLSDEKKEETKKLEEEEKKIKKVKWDEVDWEEDME